MPINKNYTKARLLQSLATLNQYITEGEDKDDIELQIAFIIQEVTESGYFIEDKKLGNICSFCGAIHSTHVIKFSRFHLRLLTKIFNHVIKTGDYKFSKKDLPDLSRAEYGSLYQLQRFWLLFFLTDENGKKLKGGDWGVPMKRVAGFLRGDVFISQFYLRDKQAKKNTPSEGKIRVMDVPTGGDEFKNEIPDFVTYDKLWDN